MKASLGTAKLSSNELFQKQLFCSDAEKQPSPGFAGLRLQVSSFSNGAPLSWFLTHCSPRPQLTVEPWEADSMAPSDLWLRVTLAWLAAFPSPRDTLVTDPPVHCATPLYTQSSLLLRYGLLPFLNSTRLFTHVTLLCDTLLCITN